MAGVGRQTAFCGTIEVGVLLHRCFYGYLFRPCLCARLGYWRFFCRLLHTARRRLSHYFLLANHWRGRSEHLPAHHGATTVSVATGVSRTLAVDAGGGIAQYRLCVPVLSRIPGGHTGDYLAHCFQLRRCYRHPLRVKRGNIESVAYAGHHRCHDRHCTNGDTAGPIDEAETATDPDGSTCSYPLQSLAAPGAAFLAGRPAGDHCLYRLWRSFLAARLPCHTLSRRHRSRLAHPRERHCDIALVGAPVRAASQSATRTRLASVARCRYL